MARKTKSLSDTEIKAAKPKEKEYNLADGEGLMLRIKPTGRKVWLFNYYRPFSKARANISFGTYPEISLAAARKKKVEYKELLAANIDPKEHEHEINRKRTDKEANTLEIITEKWFELKKAKITPDYAEDIINSLKNHVLPKLGKYPIDKITAPLVIECLSSLANDNKLEMVRRICQRLNEVMTYATNTGIVHHNPLTGIRHAFHTPTVQNNPTLKPEEIHVLVKAIQQASIRDITRHLLMWQLLTITRPGEAAGARWDEIDMDKKIWTIPPGRMKKRREHVIPLTQQMLSILDEIRAMSGNEKYLFPSDRNPKRCTNNSTANVALKRMGFQGRLTAHGMRALASTTLNEQGFDPEIIEAALAHVDKNQTRAAYNRAQYIDRRREMMEWWSELIQKS